MSIAAIDSAAAEAELAEIDLRERIERVAFEKMSKIIRIINDVFHTPPTVYEDYDPEASNHRYLVFSVEVSKSSSEIISLEKEWAKRMSEIGPGWMTARLLVYQKV